MIEIGASLSFSEVSIPEHWEEASHLISKNYEETGCLKGSQFNPSREAYEALEKLGRTRTYIARLDGKIIGYSIFFLSPNVHYGGQMWAMQDVLYFDPAHRGRLALRFMLWTETELMKAGAEVILRHVSSRHDYANTLTGLGYEKLETSYIKRLGAWV